METMEAQLSWWSDGNDGSPVELVVRRWKRWKSSCQFIIGASCTFTLPFRPTNHHLCTTLEWSTLPASGRTTYFYTDVRDISGHWGSWPAPTSSPSSSTSSPRWKVALDEGKIPLELEAGRSINSLSDPPLHPDQKYLWANSKLEGPSTQLFVWPAPSSWPAAFVQPQMEQICSAHKWTLGNTTDSLARSFNSYSQTNPGYISGFGQCTTGITLTLSEVSM